MAGRVCDGKHGEQRASGSGKGRGQVERRAACKRGRRRACRCLLSSIPTPLACGHLPPRSAPHLTPPPPSPPLTPTSLLLTWAMRSRIPSSTSLAWFSCARTDVCMCVCVGRWHGWVSICMDELGLVLMHQRGWKPSCARWERGSMVRSVAIGVGEVRAETHGRPCMHGCMCMYSYARMGAHQDRLVARLLVRAQARVSR